MIWPEDTDTLSGRAYGASPMFEGGYKAEAFEGATAIAMQGSHDAGSPSTQTLDTREALGITPVASSWHDAPASDRATLMQMLHTGSTDYYKDRARTNDDEQQSMG